MQVRILKGEYSGLLGEHIDDLDDSTAIVRLGLDEGEGGDTIHIHRSHIRPLSNIADLFDDPETASLEDDE